MQDLIFEIFKIIYLLLTIEDFCITKKSVQWTNQIMFFKLGHSFILQIVLLSGYFSENVDASFKYMGSY